MVKSGTAALLSNLHVIAFALMPRITLLLFQFTGAAFLCQIWYYV